MTTIKTYFACIVLPKERVAELNAMPDRGQIRSISDDKVAILMNYSDGWYSRPNEWVCEPIIQQFGTLIKIEENEFWKFPEYVSTDPRIFPEKWHTRFPCTFHEKVFNARTCDRRCAFPEG